MKITALRTITKKLLHALGLSLCISLVLSGPVFAITKNGVRSLLFGTYAYDPAAVECAPKPSATNVQGPVASGNGVFVIGDSLTYGGVKLGGLLEKLDAAKFDVSTAYTLDNKPGPGLLSRIQGDSVDATGGITISATNPFLDSDATALANPNITKIVIALGTNARAELITTGGGSDDAKVDAAQTIAIKALVEKIKSLNPNAKANPAGTIYWMNTYFTNNGYGNYATINQTIANNAPGNYTVLDFAAAVAADSSLAPPAGDGVHYGGDGYQRRSEWLVNQLATAASLPIAPGASAVTTGGPPLLSLTFPEFDDKAAIAKGIEDTVRANAPTSPWLQIPNLGMFVIDAGEAQNVNPLLIVSTGGVESGFGTKGAGVPNNNAFGWDKGNRRFGDWASGITAFAGFIREAMDGQHAANYTKAHTIYEYSSVHQSGGIYYPGNNKEVNGAGPDFPIHDSKMNVDVSWESPYNPLAYYKLNIKFINQITGENFPADNPVATIAVNSRTKTCGVSNGAPLPAGAGGFDLPNEAGSAYPMMYYSQLSSGSDKSVLGYFGAKLYGNDTIEKCGCGPTSMAMIVSTLTGERVEPDTMAKWAFENGFQNETCGSDWFWTDAKTQDTYGIKVAPVTGAAGIANSLTNQSNGQHLIIASVSSFPLPGVPASHITVIRKYDNGSFYFADPFSTGWEGVDDVSRRAYSADEISSIITQAWEVSAR